MAVQMVTQKVAKSAGAKAVMMAEWKAVQTAQPRVAWKVATLEPSTAESLAD